MIHLLYLWFTYENQDYNEFLRFTWEVLGITYDSSVIYLWFFYLWFTYDCLYYL